jgi:hypothetical protein
MTITWFIALVIYGLLAGFQNVSPVMWMLLLPFAVRDLRADQRNRRMDKHSRAIALLIDASVKPKDDTLEAAIDAGIVGSLIAHGPEKQKNGMSMAAVGIPMNDELRSELERRATASGKTIEEMMVELLSQRLRLRGIRFDHAFHVEAPDDDNL